MVKLKLNDNYSNTFLTTTQGEIFFKDWLKQNQPEWVRVNDDKFNSSIELRNLVKQGILIKKEETKTKKEETKIKKEELKLETKKEEPKLETKKEVKNNFYKKYN